MTNGDACPTNIGDFFLPSKKRSIGCPKPAHVSPLPAHKECVGDYFQKNETATNNRIIVIDI
jgi:hypothetical protein